MVVDDAVVARSLLRGWIDAEPDMKVVAALRTGRQAVDAIEHHDADVVMLDVDMPELDGISALPLLLKKKRGLVVIMVSTLTRRSAEVSLRALPPINFCKPAVDALFSSAAAVWGAGNLALVLTGMGTDGTRGAADLVAAGGSVIAQDEATSVVWGMPRSAAQAGLCSAVLPLDQMAANVTRLFFGDRQ
jgi:chemotaxis response regulator CheB